MEMAMMTIGFVIFMLLAGVFVAGVVGVALTTRRVAPFLWSAAPFAILVVVLLFFVRTSGVHVQQHAVIAEPPQPVPPPEYVAMATVDSSGAQSRIELRSATVTSESAEKVSGSDSSETPADVSQASPAVEITEFVGSDAAGQRLKASPAWVDEPQTDSGTPDLLKLVLVSARYASVEEAEEELLLKARPLVGSFLQRDGFDLPVSELTRQDLFAASAVTRRLHEQFQVQTRSHTEPVYRVTWQLWLRPAVAQSLASTYVPRLMQERPWKLATGLGALTLLFGAWGAFFRINESTLGRYRGRLAVAAAGLSIAAGLAAAGLFV